MPCRSIDLLMNFIAANSRGFNTVDLLRLAQEKHALPTSNIHVKP